VKEKPIVGSLFLGVLLYDCIPKEKKDVTIYFFIDSCTHRDEFIIIIL